MKLTADSIEKRWLAGIILVGLAARVVTVVILDIRPDSDYLSYQTMALNLLEGKGIIDSMGNHAMYNVGYPLFILAPVFALFGADLLAAQLVNAVLGIASTAMCYAIANEAGAGRIGRLLAAALWALYLPSWLYAEYLAKENLMTPLMLGVTWCALRLTKGISVKIAAGCGTLLGLLALTGNAGLALVTVVMAALLLAPARKGLKFAALLITFITSGVIATPWMIRNIYAIGAPVLNTNGGFNLYLGNNPAATGYFVSIADTPRGPTWNTLRGEGEARASETLQREAVDWILEHPRRFVELALRKAVLFWTPPLHEGKGQGSTMETVARRIWLLQFGVLTIAAIGGAFLSGLRTRHIGLAWLAIAAYTCVHMIFYVIFRYREPIMPLLAVLAAANLEALWLRWGCERVHSRSTRSALAAFVGKGLPPYASIRCRFRTYRLGILSRRLRSGCPFD